MRVADRRVGLGARQRGEGDPGGVGRAPGARGRGVRPGRHGLVEAGARHALVDQAPRHGGRPADALALGGEHVGPVLADEPFVHHPGEPARPWQHPEQRHLRQRHGGGTVVDEHDLLAGQGQLVATAGRRPVERGDPRLPAGRGGVLDAVAGLVGELAEVHLPRMAGAREHGDVGPGAEHPVHPAGEHDGLDARVLEPEALHGVVELDVHAQVVGVRLELVARHEPAVRIDHHRDRGDLAVHREAPVPVAAGIGVEVDGGTRSGTGLGQRSHGNLSQQGRRPSQFTISSTSVNRL